jgi:hypothetical protein
MKTDLLAEFLRQDGYSRSFCLRLLKLAKKPTKAGWDIRRLAVLMLEHQILQLSPDRLEDFDFLLAQLNLKAPGLYNDIKPPVLKEGYSTIVLRDFIPEFRRKLARLSRIHKKIDGIRTDEAALRDFLKVSRNDCKLSLARYVFTPEEVVDEILRQLHVTNGVKDLSIAQSDEFARATSSIPEFEANILRRLCAASNIYWVSEKTSSEINSLVEYPLTTVVLVVKLPGSDIEFEIKRAGRRGPYPLSVVYARNGSRVPPSHRLDGGDMLWLLQYEAIASRKLSGIYRLVHQTKAPMPFYVSRSSIYSVPGRSGEVQTIPYFSDPQLFGPRYAEMRTAMKQSVKAFKDEGNDILPKLPGDLGLTAQFIGHVVPGQAILCGTSSFRLDKLAAYLSANGPDRYFKDGLRVSYTRDDAQRLADEVLEEVLGVYVPPEVEYKSHEEYVEAALCVPENRLRADEAYLSAIEQIAKFWGTLLAVGGYTRGESFVARNVGLKSCWEQGRWKVKIIFMDHDAVVMPEQDDQHFYAKGAMSNMALDESFIWRRTNPRILAVSEMGHLQRIYRIGKKVEAKSQKLARVVLKEAYKQTQLALLTHPKLRPLFSKTYIDRLLVWDTLVSGYFQMNGDEKANGKWKKSMKKLLAAKGYNSTAFDEFMKTIEKHKGFLGRISFLFDASDGTSGKEDAKNANSKTAAFAVGSVHSR